MPRYPETNALLEQAVKHVISEQQKMLIHPMAPQLTSAILALNRLASETAEQVTRHPTHEGATILLRKSKQTEELIDRLSEALWKPLHFSVSSVYDKLVESFTRPDGKWGLIADIRAHYHNLRVRLMEQLSGARMLVLNSDLGEESERIWQQYWERQLGPSLRVLRGGHITDDNGNVSGQIDIIIVSTEAQVFSPGDADDGKAQVLIDQVVAAIMVTSTLSRQKLKKDWESLQTIPVYSAKVDDHSHLKNHTWPLCYIVAEQSDSIETLEETWVSLCEAKPLHHVPQIMLSLERGFSYAGPKSWPGPRYPRNYTEPKDVHSEEGIYIGLGLGWIAVQIQGRIAAIRRQALNAITRSARILENASAKPAVPPTLSQRFGGPDLSPISGIIRWGGTCCWVHNRIRLSAVSVMHPNTTMRAELDLIKPGIDPKSIKFKDYTDYLRWFQSNAVLIHEDLVVFVEWLNHDSPESHQRRIIVLNSTSGEESTASNDNLEHILPPTVIAEMRANPAFHFVFNNATT